MKILDIAIFMLIFTSALGALKGLNMFNAAGEITIQANVTALNATEIINTINPANTTMTQEEYYGWNVWSTFLAPIQLLVNLLKSTFALGYFIKDMIPFIPDSLALIVSGAVDAVYAAGMIQFISGRSAKMIQ